MTNIRKIASTQYAVINASWKERNDSTNSCKIDKHEKNVACTEV